MARKHLRTEDSWNWTRFGQLLVRQIDGGSLAAFRVCFGLVVCYYAINILRPVDGTNYVTSLFSGSELHFKYPGFAWVRVWAEPWMTLLVVIMAISALLLAVGLFYRLAAVLLFLSWNHYFLAEASVYNNHYYLMSLISMLLIFMPAHQCFSLDRLRLRFESRCIPFWPVFLLRFQLFILYFYGGIAKFNTDWLAGLVVVPQAKIIYHFLDQPSFLSVTFISLFLAWSGLIFDLAIGFLLVNRRTRAMAFAMVLFFHSSNHLLFNIGIFPIMALTTTMLFFEPDWPIRTWNWLRRPRIHQPDWNWFCRGGLAIPIFGLALGWKDQVSGWGKIHEGTSGKWLQRSVVAWMLIQVLVPLRHNLIAGNAAWTEEGQQLAWRMMLCKKDLTRLHFVVEDPQLQTVDSRGKSEIDWKLWPDEYPRSIYVPIDSQQFRWGNRHGFFPIYEPVLGHRLCYIPRMVDGKEELDEIARKRIRTYWQSAFNREPLIYQTVELREAIESMNKELASRPHWLDPTANPAQTKKLLHEIALDLADWLQPNSLLNEHRFKTVMELLVELIGLNGAYEVAPALKRTAPFAIQGALPFARTCYVVEDSVITDASKMIQQLVGERSPYSMVWVDLSRLLPSAWRSLPELFVILEGEKLTMLSNYHRRLNPVLSQSFNVTPFHLRRYARYIGQQWKEQTGRNAKVSASIQVRFNYTRTAPLIDPNIDLSNVNYYLMKHNEWIYPTPEDAIRLQVTETVP
jgi:vitamin K-dependent gamma-carboxylase